MQKNLICTVCPKGCHLEATLQDGQVMQITGNSCPRGEAYGLAELTHPTRVLTTTVKAVGGLHHRLPVRTASPIPKELLFAAMEELHRLQVDCPVRAGQVLVPDLLHTGVDVIACRNLD